MGDTDDRLDREAGEMGFRFLGAVLSQFGSKGVSCRRVELFAAIAVDPGQTLPELSEMTGIDPNILYHELAQLGAETVYGWPGYRLIDERCGEHGGRRQYWLTAKGERLLQVMVDSLKPEPLPAKEA